MLKNIKIGTKLIITAVVVLLIPIVSLGLISVQKASDGLRALENEQLSSRASEISVSINNVLAIEKKLVIEIAGRNVTVNAMDDNNLYADDSERYRELNRIAYKIKNTELLGDDYEDIIFIDPSGIVKACSLKETVGTNVSARPYFKTAMNGELNIGAPTVSKSTGAQIFPVASPVFDDSGAVSGVVSILVNLDFIWEIIKDSDIGETGYTFVTDADGLVIAHPDSSIVFRTHIDQLNGMEEIYSRFTAGDSGIQNYVYTGVPKTAGFASVPETGWGVFLTVTDKEFLASAHEVRAAVFIIGAAGFLIALVIFMLFAKTLTTPIRQGVQFAGEISEGKLYTDIDISRNDEIGMLVDSLKDMKAKLREVVSDVYNSSVQVSTGSNQLAQSSEQLSQGAAEQASNAEEVSSSVEQMVANIQQNTDNSFQTEKISAQAAKDAEEGGAAVLEAVDAMKEISEKITIVGDIARQTNMLSLNAAIEAARAGEHGKGFAVVAAEVGKLAAVSQQAAADILELATQSVNKANNAGEKIEAIIPDIRRTADLISEISASSNEQNSGAEQINQAMLQLDQVIQQNAASAEEASSMSEELTAQAERLKDMISFFRMSESGGEAAEADTESAARPSGKMPPARQVHTRLSISSDNFTGRNKQIKTVDDDFIEF